MARFVLWQVSFAAAVTSIVLMMMYGGLLDVMAADVTRMTSAILVVFVIGSTAVGIGVWRECRGGRAGHRIIGFSATASVSMGMIGTVGGLMYMVGHGMAGINFDDTQSVKDAFLVIADGLGFALVTTLFGIVSALLIDLQSLLLRSVEE